MKTVADFLRDPAIKSAMTQGSPAVAADALKTFHSHFKLDDCINPSQLLAICDLAFRAKAYPVSREAAQRVLKGNALIDAAYSKLGRLEAELGNHAAALDAFLRGTEANPALPFNWINAALVQWQLGKKQEAIAAASRFLALNAPPHSTTELQLLGEIGDFLFDANQRAKSLPFYQAARKHGLKKANLLVRIGEGLLATEDAAGAVALLQPALAQKQLDIWGRRALAAALSKTGAHAEALSVARDAARDAPDNPGVVDTYVDLVVRAKDQALLRKEMADNPKLFAGPAGAELRARAAVTEGRAEDAVKALMERPLVRQSRLFYVCCELVYAVMEAGAVEAAASLVAHMEKLGLDETIATVKVDVLFRQQRWEEAGEALSVLSKAGTDNPNLLLKRFEHAAFTGDRKTAEKLLPEVEAHAKTERLFMQPVMRYLAEEGRWDDLLDRAIPWMSGEFNYAQIGYLLFRACRRTRRHTELITTISKIPQVGTFPDLLRLRAELMLDRAAKPEQLGDVARDSGVIKDAALTHRIRVRREVAARLAAGGQTNALFLCTDKAYLGATGVALYSAIAQGGLANLDVYLVVGDDITDPATELADRFAEHFAQSKVNVRVLPASVVADDQDSLSPRYGLFTSGHRLSSAAYYRIFAARWLQKYGKYDRALYMDSDILIRRKLIDLLAFDMKGKPLAARVEVMRPEVRRAIELHQIKDDRYFNSGVLLFDLKSKALLPGIERSIAAITDEKVLLLYHDQCALNLGFRDEFTDLEIGFNYPMGEATRLADLPPSATVLHFLDRPKPWSNAYRGDAADLWYDAWRASADVTGEQIALDLLAQTQD